jgi:hypothetical protein
MGDNPTKEQLAAFSAEVEAHPFYREMIKIYGAARAEKAPSRSEFWGLVVQLMNVYEQLAARVKELEQRPTVKYLGIFREGKVYPPGSMVTHQGGIWHAERSTLMRPGDGAVDWTLAVKRGRDGKDGAR